jgi:hypothetical protein
MVKCYRVTSRQFRRYSYQYRRRKTVAPLVKSFQYICRGAISKIRLCLPYFILLTPICNRNYRTLYN